MKDKTNVGFSVHKCVMETCHVQCSKSNIFQNCGSNYVWLTQDYNINAKIIFKSECDQFNQLWHSRIINKDNDHNVTYSIFKLSHGKEMYTEILPEH